jgi:hypothetical protein
MLFDYLIRIRNHPQGPIYRVRDWPPASPGHDKSVPAEMPDLQIKLFIGTICPGGGGR